MSTQPKTRFTPEEYLELERKAEYKNEYYRGEIFAMAGASLKHNEIVGQLSALIAQHLRARGCRLYPADQRIATPAGLYTYPDLSVVCGPPQRSSEDRDTVTNPVLLVEVLSPTTESYDRGNKAKLYREIPSLEQLVLISQDAFEVELSTRQPDGTWLLREVKGRDGVAELTSIDYTLHLTELYERVVLD